MMLALAGGCDSQSPNKKAERPPPSPANAAPTSAPIPTTAEAVASDKTPAAVPASPKTDYERALKKLAAEMDFYQKRLKTDAPSALNTTQLAMTYVHRAQLTGDIEDYDTAGKLLEQAFKLAPANAGPYMERSGLHLSLHRMKAAQADLDSAAKGVILLPKKKQAIALGRGDIALQYGDYAAVTKHFAEAQSLGDTHAVVFRRAVIAKQGADFDAAHKLLAGVIKKLPKMSQVTAFYHLQRGLLDLERGAYSAAESHYRAADAAFTGWWLIGEHLAEILVLLDRKKEAEPIYRQVVEQTGDPELLDALADLLAETGREADAKPLRARARAGFEAMLKSHPEAAYGHAVEHFLAYGPADRALELANANYAMRSGPEAAVVLARAHLQAKAPMRAGALIEKALATPFRSVDLHLAAAEAFAALSDTTKAATHAAAARAINPHAVVPGK